MENGDGVRGNGLFFQESPTEAMGGAQALYLQTDKPCLSDAAAQCENTEDLHSLLSPAANFKLRRSHGGRKSPLPV